MYKIKYDFIDNEDKFGNLHINIQFNNGQDDYAYNNVIDYTGKSLLEINITNEYISNNEILYATSYEKVLKIIDKLLPNLVKRYPTLRFLKIRNYFDENKKRGLMPHISSISIKDTRVKDNQVLYIKCFEFINGSLNTTIQHINIKNYLEQ